MHQLHEMECSHYYPKETLPLIDVRQNITEVGMHLERGAVCFPVDEINNSRQSPSRPLARPLDDRVNL